jgi:hypothetical protein
VFLEAYARHFGRADAAAEIEIVNLRTTAIGLTDHPVIPPVREPARRLDGRRHRRRPMITGGRSSTATVYERERLPIDAAVRRPGHRRGGRRHDRRAPGWHGHRDLRGNLRLVVEVTEEGETDASECDSRKARPRRHGDGHDAFHASPMIVEVMASAGLDFFIIDFEHSPIDIAMAAHLVRAGDAAGIAPLLRIPDVDAALVKKVLNLGVQGIVLPHGTRQVVRGAAARRCATSRTASAAPARDPPGQLRSARTGRRFRIEANREILVIPLIEDPRPSPTLTRSPQWTGLDCLFPRAVRLLGRRRASPARASIIRRSPARSTMVASPRATRQVRDDLRRRSHRHALGRSLLDKACA